MHSEWIHSVLSYFLLFLVALILFYSARHYLFTYNRLFGHQRFPYLDIDTAQWPSVTVLVAAHNEEAVVGDALAALLQVDYPLEKLTIMPVNDRSTDNTRSIVDSYAKRNPKRITPFHRQNGKPGKAAALKDAMQFVMSDVIVVFDADYLPSPGLIKQLVSPFFDPEVGASMGRVVPQNVGKSLLTRLLDLERSGGYQVDQQARMNLFMVPQYGGTVGGVRVAALNEIGGWHDDVLAEDTDLTYRLLLSDWKIVYQNRSECYEEVPELWSVRVRQIERWARGHNQTFVRYLGKFLGKQGLKKIEKLDGLALLAIYAMGPLLIAGWLVSIYLFYFSPTSIIPVFIGFFVMVSFSALGNFAAFFQMAAASYLDGSGARTSLLPLVHLGFVISIISITMATIHQLIDVLLKRDLRWDKTVRFRGKK